MMRKLDPEIARQATREAAIIASQRAGRTAVAGLILAVLLVLLAALA